MKPENLQDTMLRWIYAALSALLILSPLAALGCTRGSATPFTIEETYLLFESGSAPSSSGRSSVKTVLHYAGEAYRLFPTFDDTRAAIRDFMLRRPGVLQKLELSNPFLGPLNERNCALYKEVAYGQMNAPWFEGEADQAELMELLCFLDILENEEANRRILALAEAGDVEGVMMALPDQDTLGDNLDRG